MEDAIWELERQSRLLQELRQDIAGVWDDQAARAINTRYLEPHREDDQTAREALGRQREALVATEQSLQTARVHARDAYDASAEVEAALEVARQEGTSAQRNFESYRERLLIAEAELPRVQHFLDQAEGCCPE